MAAVDYDYDAVISNCQANAQNNIDSLATDLNGLSANLVTCEDVFHATANYVAIGEIYQGFSDAIGTNQSGTQGLIALMNDTAAIYNSVYNQAVQDKAILEEGGDGSSSGSGFLDFLGKGAATIGAFATGVVEGVADFFEGAVQAVATVAAVPASIITGTIDTVTGAWDAIFGDGDGGTNLTGGMWSGVKSMWTHDLTGDWHDEFFNNTGVGSAIKDNSYAFGAVNTVGQVAGGVAAGAAVTAGAGAVVGAVGGGITTAGEGIEAASLAIGNQAAVARVAGDALGKASYGAYRAASALETAGQAVSNAGAAITAATSTTNAVNVGRAVGGAVALVD